MFHKDIYLHLNEVLPPPPINLPFYLNLDGNPDYQNQILIWQRQRSEYLLRWLAFLAESSNELIEVLISCITDFDFRSISFVRWMGDTILRIQNLSSNREELKVYLKHRLNILCGLLLKRLPKDFQIVDFPISVEKQYLPFGSRWGLAFNQPMELALTVHWNLISLKYLDTELVRFDRESGDLVQFSEGVQKFPRFFDVNGQIEVIDSNCVSLHSMSSRVGEDVTSKFMPDLFSEILHSHQLIAALYGDEARQRISQFNCGYLVKMPLENGWFNSSSGFQYPFSCFLTIYPHSTIKATESIVHETMHIFLGLLLQQTKLYENPDDQLLYRHPWMSILRPMRGVFLGAHAFTSVCDFYRRILSDQELARIAPWVEQLFLVRVSEVEQALREIESKAILTSDGERFYQTMKGTWNESYELASQLKSRHPDSTRHFA